MADNNKGKTKAAILQELESIKGLLHDEDDIPILQEVIPGAATKPQANLSNRPMAKQDLDALHKAFQALSSNVNGNPGGKHPQVNHSESGNQGPINSGGQPPMHTSNVAHPLKQQSKQAAERQQSPVEQQQPSLFSIENLDQNDFQENPVTHEPAKLRELPSVAHEEKVPLTDTADGSDVNEIVDYPANKSITPQAKRSSLAKASGENPFLPQHIRARLHGNNPPPLFDEPSSPPTPTPQPLPLVAKITGDESLPDRRNLIQQVITALVPQIQLELRQRLQDLTEDELIHLLNQEE